MALKLSSDAIPKNSHEATRITRVAFVVSRPPSTRSAPVPNATIADLIARKLPDLTHPGDGSGAISLPVSTFRMSGIPPEMAEQFSRDAGYQSANIPLLIAEAIVNLIETDGDSEIIRRSDLAAMRAAEAAAEPSRNRQVEVQCNCGATLFRAMFRDFDTDKPRVSGPELIKAIAKLSTECSTAHRPR